MIRYFMIDQNRLCYGVFDGKHALNGFFPSMTFCSKAFECINGVWQEIPCTEINDRLMGYDASESPGYMLGNQWIMDTICEISSQDASKQIDLQRKKHRSPSVKLFLKKCLSSRVQAILLILSILHGILSVSSMILIGWPLWAVISSSAILLALCLFRNGIANFIGLSLSFSLNCIIFGLLTAAPSSAGLLAYRILFIVSFFAPCCIGWASVLKGKKLK